MRRKDLENYESNRCVYNVRLARAGHATKEVDIAAGSAKNDFIALVQEWQSRIEGPRERLNETYAWRAKCRVVNQLERPAHEFKGWICVVSLTTILIIVEAGINSYLCSKGNEFGLLGGLLATVIVSAVNVGGSTRDDVEDNRLASARGAKEHQELALLECQVHAPEGLYRPEGLGQVDQRQAVGHADTPAKERSYARGLVEMALLASATPAAIESGRAPPSATARR